MMKFMRDRVKMIYWVVILSFVLLMFLGWGVGDWQAGNIVSDPGTIAVVNGEEITRAQWEDHANSILRTMRQRTGAETNESDVLRARDQAYNDLVVNVLMRQEAQKRKLGVTDAEVDEILQNSPPPELLALFTDAEGNVDYDAYYQQLNSPSTDWVMLRNSFRKEIPLQKLRQQIAGAALVGDAELRATFDEQNARMVAEWVGVLFSDVDLGEGATVTDEEIQAWYESHQEDFRQEAMARVRVVTAPKEASQADEDEVLSILNEIRLDIVEGRLKFEDAARTYSEDTSASTGGDLGFFDRNRMTPPFTEAAFNLAVGDVSEPVKTQFGYHLIECIDERLDDRGRRTEIQARHILLRLHPSQATLDALRDEIYAAREAAATIGIDTAAQNAGLTVVDTPGFSEGMNIPGIGSSLLASRYAFGHDAGSLSEVYENEDVAYFLQIAEQIPAGYSPLEDVRAIVESNVLRDKRAQVASEKLAAAVATADAQTDLARLARSSGLSHAVTDTFGVRENIEDVGFASAFARAAMEMGQGEFCRRVETPRGVYAFKLLYRSPFDEDAFMVGRNQLAGSMLYARQQGVLQQWLAEQMEKAEIEDLRNRAL